MRKRYVKRWAVKFIYLVLAIVIGFIVIAKFSEIRIKDYPNYVLPRDDENNEAKVDIEVLFPIPTAVGEKKDWNDYALMAAERKRAGTGENGAAAYINDISQKELEKNLSMQNGFNALLSDKISVNRSVPDVRREECRSLLYLSNLPTVSIILPFFDEYFSVLIRSLYSIVNRTPKELLKEIIIVDDNSDREYLKQELDDYIAQNFHGLVQIVRLTRRTGLIGARLAGARVATADVLIFFDSHIECNYNWLPPLLEPIAVNPKISTCPLIDGIAHDTFAYKSADNGARGGFNWNFEYSNLPLLPKDLEDRTRPYRDPVMMGGLFAIGRRFFWELGGYDEGLDIWGGEQFEVSFKIWMCGGMVLDVPCSHVAHVFRGPMITRPNPRKHSFVWTNYKRVAEVWMDEYKQYIYMRKPRVYAGLDPGDLTVPLAIRARLQCKPFKWFMEMVAPDFLKAFPPIAPPAYASGVLQSVAYPQYCLDTLNGGRESAVGMYYCANNKTNPQENQFWSLSYYRDVRAHDKYCLDVHDSKANATVWMYACHHGGGNQFWYYDHNRKLLQHGRGSAKCMEAVIEHGQQKVYANNCDILNKRMKWDFGFVNHTMLDNFYANLKS